ncbi:MAG: hypothetical protein IT306_31530 [Chloroflexi bacterium]|nr:hypothetical protein [Chloroflexota bacterium]
MLATQQLSTRGAVPHILVAIAAIAAYLTLDTLTGNAVADGTIGVLLGLYLTSGPAARAIDVIMGDRFTAQAIWNTAQGHRWLALNGLVLLGGWAVILLGMIALVGA